MRANRVKNATQAQNMCSKQLLRTMSGGEKAFGDVKRFKSGEANLQHKKEANLQTK